jgi:hypothetical protein
MLQRKDLSAISCGVVASCLVLAVGCALPVKEVIVGATPQPGGKVVIRTASVANYDAYGAAKAAAQALQKKMGDTVPQAVIVSENFEERADKKRVLKGICAVFPSDVVFGMATYGSFGQSGCMAGDSVTLVGIGGAGVSVSAALERRFGAAKLTVAKDKAQIEERLHAAGTHLAQKLQRRPAQGQLLILLADAHFPKNQSLVEGMQKVLGNDFPIVGGCANKNAGQTFVYYRGRMFEDSGVALLLTGDFKVGLAGRKAKDNARVIATAREAGAEALANVKGKPTAAFAFNCAGRKGKLKNIEDELAAIQSAIGKTLPLFGCYCAGEIGPLDEPKKRPGVLSAGAGWHVMFAILGR